VRWIFPEPIDDPAIASFAQDIGVPRFLSEILWRRGLRDASTASAFLDPRLKSLRDPFLLPDMEAAITRVIAAIERHERIVFYGDYDVDGVSSLALLTRVFAACGATTACFLPHRVDEGYGLSREGISRCIEEHRPQLLIAVDCGTTSVAEIDLLGERGVDVIVLDHHECAPALPACVALVNPKRGQSDRYLCSAGLAFKFAHALLKRRPVAGFDLRQVLDLVALGTVADLVPLIDENRLLVKHGLLRLGCSAWPGVRALIEVAGFNAPFTATHVGFGLGPRLNAAGRLGTAQNALDLLLTDDSDHAWTLATALDAQNRDRRAVEELVCKEAEDDLATWFDPSRHAAIVVGRPGWHPGVIGIVASRISRRHHRPTIVVGFDDSGAGKGSGRSITGFSLVAALSSCSTHLERFGGHELAAGLSVNLANLTPFREAFLALAQAQLSAEQLLPRLHLDAEVRFSDIGLNLLGHVESLAPYGSGHRQPVFYARGVSPAMAPRILKEKHLSLLLRQEGVETRAIWFGSAANPLPNPPWDIAFELTRNEYQGSVTAQIQVAALRSSV
jgi:single-stranded-DNA-specific exonuclease